MVPAIVFVRETSKQGSGDMSSTQQDPAEIQEELARVAAALERRRDELVVLQMEALKQFSAYSNVPHSDLVRSCHRNVVRVVSMLRGEAELPSDVVEDERASGGRRARQGIPAEVVVAAYRSVIGVIRDDFLASAPEAGVSVDGILLGMRRLWDLTDHFSSTLVSARHQVDLEQVRQAEQQRMSFLQRALDGSASTSELVQSSERYGMHEAGSYWVVRGSLTEDGAESCLRSLERQGSSPGFVPLLARHGLGVSGIVGRSLETFGKSDATLAVVGPVSMERLTDAFGEASRVLRAALQLGCRGVVDMATLSLRLAVVEQKDVAAERVKFSV